jgi:hypothetical protein
MRKVVLYELLSLDGVAEDPDKFFRDWDEEGDDCWRDCLRFASNRSAAQRHPGVTCLPTIASRGDSARPDLTSKHFAGSNPISCGAGCPVRPPQAFFPAILD